MNILSSPSTNGCEDSTAMDDSTAPTTPEGSYMSSPLLRPQILESMAMCMAQDRPIRNICCVGAGYVGGPTAAVIAFNNPNIQVTVVDLNATRIRRWNSRHPPIFEPGLANIVRVARDGTRDVVLSNEPAAQTCSLSQAGNSEIILPDAAAHSKPPGQAAAANQQITVPSRQPNLFFSTQVDKCISEADIVLIAVNTPTKTRGAGKGCATDMAAFEAVTADVARHARPGAIIVEKSTVPCRTAQMVQQTMAIHRPGVHFEILSNPEFLAAGTAVHDLLYPDRVLIGCSPTSAGRRAAAALASVYGAWVARERILTTNVWSSELAKLVANSMLAQRISSINSIAAVCEETGANVDEVAAAIGADPRIGDKFLKAGIGFGGSCFKKDVLSLVYLAQSLGLDEVAAYWRQVHSMNEYSRNRFAARVVRCLNNTLAGKKVTVLGYAFKKNTNDTRESPALEIIRTLLEEGPREVAIFDPCCHPGMVREEVKRLLGEDLAFKILKEEGGPLVVYENAYEACAGSNAVLITTDFDEFRNNSSSQQKKHLHGINTGSISPDGVASAGKKLGRVVSLDLRPFESVESSELDLLSLHKHLTEQASSKFPSLGSGFTESMDPLKRFNAEPPCDVDCPDCSLQNSGYAPHEEYKTKDKIDWAKISYHMSKPRWLFDGKGVLEDIKEMELLGFCVKSVGR
ncbi:UDP-glucose 6-dehydrogenase [Cryphonectria parasitica EP155]|uniref:UDP-glucose 6-dehydrogenase n=1 Tax=Cryphonectria parasitica (strain ATCC 38755 / EP155) TaxID=660469 RepID=A0A9P5CPU7_CRYP1|nr:UDP-glucose 6-dehydrogenase [Cryphonectria parasitica EP155]KAF3766849.1 UDP-glucose 6-dehydrogenase [Cryphonectria parasitica EP155]